MHYDPAFAYEISHVMQSGLERMYGEDAEDVIFYVTVYNEPVEQPAEPEGVDTDGILRGMHRVSEGEGEGTRVQLLASGVAYPWIKDAARMLAEEWGVQSDTWSVTSWNELARDAVAAEEWNLLHPDQERTAYVEDRLNGVNGPVVAVSDYMRAVPLQIARWIPSDYRVLGATVSAWPTPGPRPVGTSTSTRSPWSCRPSRRWPTRARSSRRRSSRPSRSTASTTPRPSPT